jgi:hypothetical protein
MGREATALISTVLALLVLGTMPLVVEKVEGQDEEKQKEEEGQEALRGAEAPLKALLPALFYY